MTIKKEDTQSVNMGTGSSLPVKNQTGFTVPTKPTKTPTKPSAKLKKNNRVTIQTAKIPKSQRGKR
jgi:hypothetical protein